MICFPDLHVLSPFVSYDFSYRWNEEDRVDRVCPYILILRSLSCSDLSDEANGRVVRKAA